MADGTPTTPAATPATAGFAPIPDPKRSPQSYANYMTAQQNQAEADRTAKINSNVSAVYSPLQSLLTTQKNAATKRYAQNQADITSIFGALSSLTAADTARVNKQFTDSLTKQQTDYATRVAQQNAETAAGTQQAVATGAERGTGPAMAANPIQAAAAQGNANANAALTNWQGLMQAEQAQTVKDVENRGTGYTQQKLGALSQLSKNFEDTLTQFDAKSADLESQMAQAKQTQQAALAANDFEAAQNAQKAIDALDLQKTKNDSAQKVASITAEARLKGIQLQQAGANSRAASSASKTKYAQDVVGTINRITDTYGANTASAFQTALDNVTSTGKDAKSAYNLFIKNFANKPAFQKLPQATQTDLKASIKNELKRQFGTGTGTFTLSGVQ